MVEQGADSPHANKQTTVSICYYGFHPIETKSSRINFTCQLLQLLQRPQPPAHISFSSSRFSARYSSSSGSGSSSSSSSSSSIIIFMISSDRVRSKNDSFMIRHQVTNPPQQASRFFQLCRCVLNTHCREFSLAMFAVKHRFANFEMDALTTGQKVTGPLPWE